LKKLDDFERYPLYEGKLFFNEIKPNYRQIERFDFDPKTSPSDPGKSYALSYSSCSIPQAKSQ